MPLFPFSLQGALARESLPAAGSAYATDIQRAELRLLFRRHGCHHCGKRFGPVIADHQPPNKTVYGARDPAALSRESGTVHSLSQCNVWACRQHRRRGGSRSCAEGGGRQPDCGARHMLPACVRP